MNHVRATNWILSLLGAVGINIWYVSSDLIPCTDNIDILYLWPFCHLDIGCVKGVHLNMTGNENDSVPFTLCILACQYSIQKYHKYVTNDLGFEEIMPVFASEDDVFLYFTLWMRLVCSYTRPFPSVPLFICFRSCPLSVYLSDMMRVILTSREPRAARTSDLSL